MTLTPHQKNGESTSGAWCPDAETLASYVDGRTTAATREEIESHLARCEDCYFVFSEAVQQLKSQESHDRDGSTITRLLRWPAQFSNWKLAYVETAGLAAAAAMIIVVVAIVSSSQRMQPGAGAQVQVALNELDAAAGPYRKYAPRLTVIPTHHELEPALRSAEPSADPSLTQREAVRQRALREALQKMESMPRAQRIGVEVPRALAAGYFALGRPQLAVDALEPVAQSNDAGLLSDLAAAHLARRADGDVERALDLLNRAVTLDPKCAEAWFNLGLAAEAARQTARAQEAWKQYLVVDPSSEWANEARWHLEKLQR